MEEVPGPQPPLFVLHDEDALAREDEEVLLHGLRVVLPVRLARLDDVDADPVLLEAFRRLEVGPLAALDAPPPARVGEVDHEPPRRRSRDTFLGLLECVLAQPPRRGDYFRRTWRLQPIWKFWMFVTQAVTTTLRESGV